MLFGCGPAAWMGGFRNRHLCGQLLLESQRRMPVSQWSVHWVSMGTSTMNLKLFSALTDGINTEGQNKTVSLLWVRGLSLYPISDHFRRLVVDSVATSCITLSVDAHLRWWHRRTTCGGVKEEKIQLFLMEVVFSDLGIMNPMPLEKLMVLQWLGGSQALTIHSVWTGAWYTRPVIYNVGHNEEA